MAWKGTFPDAEVVGQVEFEAERLAAPFGGHRPALADANGAGAKLDAQMRLSPGRLRLDEMDVSAEGASATGAVDLAFGDRPRGGHRSRFFQVNVDRLPTANASMSHPSWRCFWSACPSPPVGPAVRSVGSVAGEGRCNEGRRQYRARRRPLAALQDGTLFLERAEVLLPGGSDLSLNGVLEPRRDSLAFEGRWRSHPTICAR